MKKLIVLAIAALSVTAFAQSETATVAGTETTVPAQVVAKKSTSDKKAKKGSSKKEKATKQTTSMATEVTSPVIANDTPITAKEEKSMTPADINTAAGVSTAKVSQADADQKFKGTLRAVTDMDESYTQSIQTLSTVGISYKAANKLTIKLAETFETLNATGIKADEADQRELVDRNNFRGAFTDLAVASSLPGMMGSNDMPVSLVYRKITGDAAISQKGKYSNIDGLVDLNVGLPYSLTPKVDLSIDGQVREVLNDEGPISTRVLLIPTISYTINDMVSIYQSAGLMVSLKDGSDLRRTRERLSIATGMSVAATKNLSFDLNVSQDKAIYTSPTSGSDITPFTLYSANNTADPKRNFDSVSYELAAIYNF